MNQKILQQRRAILAEMEGIERMELGALAEEYREVRAGGQTVRNGPYFKHQQWLAGRNQSRRVPAQDASALREAVEGRQRFEQLARRFVDLTVAATRGQADPSESKKNSSKRRSRPDMAKRKAS